MKIFFAGASGALGKRLLPQLIAAGHHVVAATRTAAKAAGLRSMGAEPVVFDALDEDAVREAVAAARPEVVLHQMTALTRMRNFKKFDQEFTLTNCLRTDGTAYLLSASRAAGVRRFIAQSYTGWPNIREGGPVKTEEDPFDPHPPKAMRQSLEAIRQLESSVTGDVGLTGLVLRYGGFYGPGTSLASSGMMTNMVRERKFPLVGSGAGVWSFLHIDDAAAATRLAIENGPAGIYNVVDDEPAPVSTWLPELACILGAKPPLHLPAWLGRLALGEAGLSMMTSVRGSSNDKAKRLLNWKPVYASWREGFRFGLS